VTVFAGVCGLGVDDAARREVERMSSSISQGGVKLTRVTHATPYAHVSASRSSRLADMDIHTHDDIAVILCGELYDRGRCQPGDSGVDGGDAALLHTLYRDDPSCGWLDDLDGEFSLIVVDGQRSVVLLACDRLGIGRVYMFHEGTRYWFCSAPSALTVVHQLSMRVDEDAAEQFLDVGYMLGDRTWLKGCTLLPPAAVWSLDAASGTTKVRQYWDLNMIEPQPQALREHEAAATCAALFRQAVARRCRVDDCLTVTLSGGLDSRAVLAAARECGAKVTAVTFGRRESPDVRIAAQVARTSGVRHRIVEIGPQNWLQPRIAGVWRTGGEFPILDMHGVEALDVLAREGVVNLHGLAGDTTLRGMHLQPRALDGPVGILDVCRVTGGHASILMPAVEASSRDRKTDYFYLRNRIRRFTALGPALLEGTTVDRKPFIDRALLDFVYSLPDALRLHGKLYRTMLLYAFPELYRSIPWQKTGVPLGWPSGVRWVVSTARRSVSRLRRALGLPAARGYAAYAEWLRLPPARDVVERVLMNPRALYPDVCDSARGQSAWAALLNGAETSATVSRYLTTELWLQQAFQGRWRDWESLLAELPEVGRRSST